MYQTSDNYKSKIYNTPHTLKVLINDIEINSKHILDCKPSQLLFPSDEFALGSAAAQEIDLKLYKTAVPESINKVEIKSGIISETLPIGIFNVDDISKDDDYTITLKLIDNMIKFEFNYDGSTLLRNNGGKVQIIQVLQDICSKAGVELGSTSFLNMNKEIAVYDNTISARIYLSYIAEQAGGIATIGRDGKLYIKNFKFAPGKKIGEGKSVVVDKTNNLKAKIIIKGNHSQDTRSGRNLYDIKNVGDRTIPTEISIDDDDWITVTADNSSGTSNKYVNYSTENLKLKTNTTYAIFIEIKIATGSDNVMLFPISHINSEGQFAVDKFVKISQMQTTKIFRFIETTRDSFTNTTKGLRTAITFPAGTSGTITFRLSVIEDTSIGLDNFEYEKYGASPTTDYPSEIKTAGNNINYFKIEPQSSYGVNITVKDDGAIALNGTATQTVRITNVVDLGTGDFTLSVKSNKVDGGVYVRTRNKAGTLGLTTPLTGTSKIISNNTEAYSTELTINKDTVLEDFILYPKLERGLVATLYSPFGMGSVKIDVVNKNLLNIVNTEEVIKGGIAYSVKNGILKLNGTATANFDIQLSKNIKIKKGEYTHSASYIQSGLYISFDNLEYTMISAVKGKKRTFKITEDTTYKTYFIWIDKGTVLNNVEIKLQLEAGDTATDFVEHQSQTATIPIQQEMLEGDYIDDVEHHEWGKMVLTGNETDFNIYAGKNAKKLNYFYFSQKLSKPNGNIISNMLKNNIDIWNATQYIDGVKMSNSKPIINIMLSDTTITTVAQFKTKLRELYNAGTPLILYYELAEPLELQLTEEQKQIQNIELYEDYTAITSEAEMKVNFAIAEIPVKYFQNFKWGEKFKISRVRYEDGVQIFEKGATSDNTVYINQDNMYIVDQEQIDNIYNALDQLEVYSFEGDSIIDPAYDVGDILVVDGKKVLYQGTMQFTGKWKANLNNKIQSKNKEETTTRKTSQKTINRRVQSSIDQVEGKITQLAQETSENTEKITKHEQTIDSINDKVSNIADLTKTSANIKTLTLDNCANGELLQLNIYGNNTIFKPFVLSDDLYLSDELFLTDVESIVTVTDENDNTTDYDLKITDTLRQNGNVKDEYILDGGKAKIIRRINLDGSIKDNEEIEDLGELHIILTQGTNRVQIKDYNAEMYAKWALKSDLTDTFATKVQVNTSITQTSTQIMTEVNKKIDEEELGTKIIQDFESVQVAWNKISDFIKMMVFNNNASLCIVDESKNVIASFDKEGEHFYKSGETISFGEMGVQTVDNKQYIAFSVEGEYESDIANGMAWGIKTKSDNKFYPIFYIKDFSMGAKNSDAWNGSLVLTACNIVLNGLGTGIRTGGVDITGDPTRERIILL